MDVLRAYLIEPHTGLYAYGSANYGSPLPFYLWPSTAFGLIVVYLLLVKVLLPIHMNGRKPYNLRPFMLTYNALQLMANLYIGTFMLIEAIRIGDFDITHCASTTPTLIQMNMLWILNKYCDLTDTIIFVLRRKYNQASFLHVYHHVMVVYYAYMSFVETPGGFQRFVGLMNTIVHSLMYAYYFASIYDKQLVDRFLDYKKRITQLQMVQFCINVLNFGRASIGLCIWPKYLAYAGSLQNVILLVLFSNFYYKTYLRKQKV